MFELTVQNKKGEQLRLTDSKSYDVLEISGLNPPAASISTSTVTGTDGVRFGSSRIEKRNVVITLNIKYPIEENRINLYRFFQVKRYIKLYFSTRTRSVWIEGIVESFENNHFTNRQKPVISIICPDPYWKSADERTFDFTESVSLFEFPFEIPTGGIAFSERIVKTSEYINTGDVPTGGIITFTASGTVTNPKIINNTTGEFFGFDYEMQSGDKIVLNTNYGEKSAVLKHSYYETNIISSRITGSKWIQFEAGENSISYTADSGAEYLSVKVSAVQKYEGV
jgi:phage-related protein